MKGRSRWVSLLSFVLAAALFAIPSGATAATFSSETVINIPASPIDSYSGKGDPYPSTIEVKGMPGAVLGVRVEFGYMAHTEPHEVDILLVGPAGQNSLLISDACGTETILNVKFAFDDSAAGPLSATGPCPSGAYRPTNHGPNSGPNFAEYLDFIFPPGPPPSGTTYSTGLSVFGGTDPNGVWSLYGVDEGPTGGSGGVSGWTLDIHAAARCKGKPATLVGANGRGDELFGTKGRDVIAGLSGNDRIRGRGGNDLICGGAGKDDLDGGKGRDKLLGEAGGDELKGGGGKDNCQGGGGKDSASGCEVRKSASGRQRRKGE